MDTRSVRRTALVAVIAGALVHSYARPGVPPENGIDPAWASALTLIIVVAILFTVARLLARLLEPKGR